MSVRLIKLAMAPGDVVHISNRSIADNVSGGTAQARYQLTSGGKAQQARNHVAGGAFQDLEDWVLPNGNAANYECFATVNAGSLSSGTSGSWLALTSTRTWGKSTTNNDASVDITVDIRRVGTTTVLTSASIHLEANSTP